MPPPAHPFPDSLQGPFSSYPGRDVVFDDILSQHGRISDVVLHLMRSLEEACQEVANALHASQLGRRYLIARDSIERRVKGPQLQLELDESLVHNPRLFVLSVISYLFGQLNQSRYVNEWVAECFCISEFRSRGTDIGSRVLKGSEASRHNGRFGPQRGFCCSVRTAVGLGFDSAPVK